MSTKRLNSRSSNTTTPTWTGNPGLKKLCTLLRDEGDRVLSGSSNFTLTTEVLAQLNADCRRHSISENDITTPELTVSDRSFLPLTSRLRAQQEAIRTKAEWSDHIQFIKDFMLSTPSLKLIRYSGTLSSPISLHRFGNLTNLNLRKVPIHMVEGLHKLRDTLVSLTAYRCVDKVKNLLEFCGGDMTAPMAWPQLKFVSFMFNSVTALDDSLRLLPYVEVFDLSHNSLETCDKFLEYLGDARRITLAYNFLSSVPSFFSTARTSLTCLVLRGNNLDNVKGLEVLTALQDLDLGENCISDHTSLDPLGCLIRLQKLQLDGNPVFYHKLHRPLTGARLAPQVVSVEFELDKRQLTVSEISKVEFKRATPHLSYPKQIRARENLLDNEYGVSPSSGIGTENESANSIISYKSKKKNKRKKMRARYTEIVDLENSGEVSSSGGERTPGTSPHPWSLEQQLKTKRDEAIKTQKEIEELRKYYGPNWLQAIEDRDIFNLKKSALASTLSESSDAQTENTDAETSSSTKFFVGSKSSNSSDCKHEKSGRSTRQHGSESDSHFKNDGFPTDDDLYLTDTRMNDTNKPIMATIAKLASGFSTDDTDGGNKPTSNFYLPAFDSQDELIVENNGPKTDFIKAENSDIVSAKFASPHLTVGTSADTGANSQISSNSHLEKSNQGYVSDSTSALNKTFQPSDKLLEDQNETSKFKYSESVLPITPKIEISSKRHTIDLKNSLATSPDNSDVETSPSFSLEKDEVTESMFATLPLQNNAIIIMTLTASYLVEKDIRGKVTEKLELASLTDMKWKNTKKSSDHTVGKSDHVLGESPNTGMVSATKDLKQKITGESADDRTERVQLDLKFDYVRKDRQSRCYIVDSTDGKIIIDHLQPFLDSREDKEKAQLMIVMQCLKCNRTFLKSELIQQKSNVPTRGSSKDLQSMKDLMGKTTLKCPKCGSAIIIELDPTSTPVGSYTSSTGSYIDQGKKSRRRSFDKTKDNQSRLPGMPGIRDRNLARIIQPRMTRSAITSGEYQLSEDEELAYNEDHFSADAMTDIKTSSHVVDLTTSLQGDLSTKGSKAAVRRISLQESNSGVSIENEPKITNLRQRILMDSGYESGIKNGIDNPTRPISIERRASHELRSDGNNSKPEEKSQTGLERSAIRGNLAAMEDIVNSLVSEGKCLEEQEGFAVGSYSSNKVKSVSISTFKKASGGHGRKISVGSVDGLKHSESSSSIAVIPVLSSSSDAFTTVSKLSSSVPLAFSGGTHADRHISEANAEKSGNTLISPLSSSICSSMVSSVYESSVNNPDGKNDANINDTDNANASATDGSVIVVGSSSSSSEDLTSIYDHPREPKSLSRKKLHPKVKSPAAPSAAQMETANSDTGDSTGSKVLDIQNDCQGRLGTPTTQDQSSGKSIKTTNNMVTGLESCVNENSDVDEEDEGNGEEIVPQYAFHHLNHRLTLYMMMSLFGPDEGFVCKLQGDVIQYIIPKPYEGILVMSSSRFYILKITSEDHSQPPDQWLQCVEIQPIPELRHIDVGLGGQSLRLEFVTDCSSYTVITRNRDKTMQFVDMLHTNLAKYAVSHGIGSHVVVNEDVDEATMTNLDHDVVSKVTPDQKLLYYCMGFIERGNQKQFPVSFVITTCDVCLVCANHQWPQPRLQAPITEETVGKQFTVLERQKVSNVASLAVCEATMKKIRLELFSETEGISASWNITLTTRQSTVDFINALSEPWAREFGVEMDVVYAELHF